MNDDAVSPEAPEYAAARIHRALAEDPRTAELGVEVRVFSEKIFLHGTVPSEQRRSRITEVAGAQAPGFDVHNEVLVMEAGEPPQREELP